MIALVLLAALLMASPSLHAAFTGSGPVETALLHLVLALGVAALGGRILRHLVTSYAERPPVAAETEPQPENHGRRRSDEPEVPR